MITTKFQMNEKDPELMTTKEEREMADTMYTECVYRPKNYGVLAKVFSVTSGYRMITYILGTPNAIKSIKPIKSGYKLAYVVNLDIPHFSELGEVYIEVNSSGEMTREQKANQLGTCSMII